MSIAVHSFESTGEAYDATQCREDILSGDILFIPSEQVVGIADTWPVAVTKEYGKLHSPANGFSLEACFAGRKAKRGLSEAIALARSMGWQVHGEHHDVMYLYDFDAHCQDWLMRQLELALYCDQLVWC